MYLSHQSLSPVPRRTDADPCLSFPNNITHLQDTCNGLNSVPPPKFKSMQNLRKGPCTCD